eukprot:scaffold95060_cov59-Phaeocystis_antarctica.AAC.2
MSQQKLTETTIKTSKETADSNQDLEGPIRRGGTASLPRAGFDHLGRAAGARLAVVDLVIRRVRAGVQRLASGIRRHRPKPPKRRSRLLALVDASELTESRRPSVTPRFSGADRGTPGVCQRLVVPERLREHRAPSHRPNKVLQWLLPERVGEQAIEPAPLRVEVLLLRDAVELWAELIGGRVPPNPGFGLST